MQYSQPLLALAITALLGHAAVAQSTAFVYQGELKSGGAAASGVHDLRFRLYDSPIGGTQIGTTLCFDNVAITNGVFSTTVDFGSQFSSTASRYLEIEVRSDTGLSCGNTTGYTVLSPRQPLAPAPRATAATTANSLALPNGSSVLVNLTNTGNVGIGTNAPASQLHLNGAQDAFKITANQPFMTMTDSNASGSPRVQLQNFQGNYFVLSESFLNGTNTAGYTMVDRQGRLSVGNLNPVGPFEVWSGGQSYFRIDALNGDMHINGGADGFGGIHNDGPASGGTGIFSSHGAIFQVANTGNVGIGTNTPSAKLDVNGSIKVAPAIRWRSLHGSAFVPAYLNDPVFGTTGGMHVLDSFGTTTSGTVGFYNGSSPAFYFAPLELPDGATLLDVCLDARDTLATSDMSISLGRITLSTGLVTEVITSFTSGSGNFIQHICSGPPAGEPLVDNSNYVYFLRARMQSNGSMNHELLAARVKFSVTSPLP